MEENLTPVPEEEQAKTKKVLAMIRKAAIFGKSKVGITRKNNSSDKKAVKRSKKSRKINARIAKKVFRPTGSKKRK